MFLLSFASADYKFQNDGGTNLVRIHSENGNLSVLGNVSAPYFVGSGKYLTDIETDPAVINYWKKNMHDELYYNDANVGIGTNDPSSKLEVNGTLGLLNENELSSSLVTLDGHSSHGLKVQNSEGYVNIAPLNGGWAHIYTDRSNFIFNKPVYTIGGKFASYSTADLILSAGGSQKSLVIDNPTGNVGIGTDNPSSKLDVVGGINATGVVNADDVCVDGICLSDIGAGNMNASDSELLDGYDASFFMPLNKSVTGDFDFNGGWTDGGVSIVDGNVYAQSGYFYDINSLQVTNLAVNGSLVPETGFDNQFDIGSSSVRWRDGYFGRNVNVADNIYLGSTKSRISSDGDGSIDLNYGTGSTKAFSWYGGGTSSLVTMQSDGNVGIGTDNPKADLDVGSHIGNGKLRTVFARLGEGDSTEDGTFLGVRAWNTQTNAYDGKSFSIEHSFYGEENSAINFYRGSGTTGGDIRFAVGSGAETVIFSHAGNVGIGDMTPASNLKLDVEGPVGATQYCDQNGNNCKTMSQIMDGGKWNVSGSNMYPKDLSLNVGIGKNNPSRTLDVNGTARAKVIEYNHPISADATRFSTAYSVYSGVGYGLTTRDNNGEVKMFVGHKDYSNSNILLNPASGNVGIGTNNPLKKLQVAEDLTYSQSQSGQLYLSGKSDPNKRLMLGYDTTNNFGFIEGINFGVEYSDIILNPHSGNVGIGTTDPDAKLDIKTTPGFNRALKIGPQTVNEGDGAYIEFASSSTDGYGAQIGGLRAGAGKGDLVIRTGGNNQQERMRVTNEGNVEVKKKLIIGNSEISTMANGDVNVW